MDRAIGGPGWSNLLNTHNQFDQDSSDDENNSDVHNLNESVSPINFASHAHSFSKSSILSLALIHFLCKSLEENWERRSILFKTVCEELCRHKFLDPNIAILQNFVKPQIGDEIFSFMENIQRQVLDTFNLSLPMPSTYLYQASQYEESFEEIGVIATGGFGIVAKAKNKIDGVIYAVKKIFFKCRNDKEFEKITREAKSFASLKHQNIVNYNCAWLDNGSNVKCESSSSASSSSEASTVEKSNSSNKQEDYDSGSSSDIQFTEDCSSSHIASIKVTQTSETYTMNIDVSCESPDASFSTNASNSSTSLSSSSIISHETERVSTSSVASTVKGRQRHSSGPTCSSLDYTVGNQIIVPAIKITNDDVKEVRQGFRLPMAPFPSIKATLYIQMEYCDFDLRTWLDGRNDNLEHFLTWKNMHPLNIFHQVLCGISHIHSKSVIHRDLKPKNIFIMEQSRIVKIGDFGLACLVHQTDKEPCLHCNCDTNYSEGLGTPPYAAPEQITTRNYDFKVDIFSAGIILFELLFPYKTAMEFSSEVSKIISGEFPSSLKANHVAIIKKMIKQDPRERPTAAQILQYPLFTKTKTSKLVEEFGQKTSELKGVLEETIKVNEELKKEVLENRDQIKFLESEVQQKDIVIESLKEQIAILKLSSKC